MGGDFGQHDLVYSWGVGVVNGAVINPMTYTRALASSEGQNDDSNGPTNVVPPAYSIDTMKDQKDSMKEGCGSCGGVGWWQEGGNPSSTMPPGADDDQQVLLRRRRPDAYAHPSFAEDVNLATVDEELAEAAPTFGASTRTIMAFLG